MPRRRKYSTYHLATPVIIAVCVFIGFIYSFAGWLDTTLGIPSEFTFTFFLMASAALIVGVIIAIIAWIVISNKNTERKYRGIKIANVDVMDGVDFERYLQRLLASKGYNVRTTSVSGDLGVDLVAVKNNEKIAIQAKRYNSNVSRRAISDAVAGMHHYGCNQAMVITNNYFSPGAITLAQSTNCILVDRDTLAKWINEFQNTALQIVQPPSDAH